MLKDFSKLEKLLVSLIALTLIFIIAAETGLIPVTNPKVSKQDKEVEKAKTLSHKDKPKLSKKSSASVPAHTKKKVQASPATKKGASGQKLQAVSEHPSLGPIMAKRESSITIQLERDEINKLVPCQYPTPECLQKQKEASRAIVKPAEGKSFVRIVFGKAPNREEINFGEQSYGLIIEGGGELKPYAVMTQVNKLEYIDEAMKRVPWPDGTVLKRNVFATNFLPMVGDKPFTLVFEVSAGVKSGKIRVKSDQISVNW